MRNSKRVLEASKNDRKLLLPTFRYDFSREIDRFTQAHTPRTFIISFVHIFYTSCENGPLREGGFMNKESHIYRNDTVRKLMQLFLSRNIIMYISIYLKICTTRAKHEGTQVVLQYHIIQA